MLPAASVSGLYFSHPAGEVLQRRPDRSRSAGVLREAQGHGGRGGRALAGAEPGLRSGGARDAVLNAAVVRQPAARPIMIRACLRLKSQPDGPAADVSGLSRAELQRSVSNRRKDQPSTCRNRLMTRMTMPLLRPWRSQPGRCFSSWPGWRPSCGCCRGSGIVAPAAANGQESSARQGAVTVARRDFVRAVRLSGTVEAVQSTTIAAPRLAGPNTQSLVITRLVRPGSTVQPGDLIVEFDRQEQIKNALDRRAELQDLEQQIRKREAQERAAARERRQRDQGRRERAWRGPSSRWSRTSMIAEDQRREEHAGARAGAGDAQAAEDDLRAEAEGGGGGHPHPADPPRPGRERDDDRPRPTPSAWRSARRSAAWRW